MTKDEALHKALKVLNCLNNNRMYETAWVKGAINACEEALEQKDENDQHWYNEGYGQGKFDALMDAELAQEEQPAATPVAYMNELGFAETKEGLVPNFGRVVPLYTRPSKDDPQDWNEDRLDTIGQNGNDGLHYDDIS